MIYLGESLDYKILTTLYQYQKICSKVLSFEGKNIFLVVCKQAVASLWINFDFYKKRIKMVFCENLFDEYRTLIVSLFY